MDSHSALPFSRSDFAPLREMNFGRPPAPEQPPTEPQAGRLEVPLEELSFRHLRTPAEIALIRHLREEIRLPAAVLADPGFRVHEKKETSTGSSRLFSAAEYSSGRFASSRWTVGSPLARKYSSSMRSCRRIFIKQAGK